MLRIFVGLEFFHRKDALETETGIRQILPTSFLPIQHCQYSGNEEATILHAFDGGEQSAAGCDHVFQHHDVSARLKVGSSFQKLVGAMTLWLFAHDDAGQRPVHEKGKQTGGTDQGISTKRHPCHSMDVVEIRSQHIHEKTGYEDSSLRVQGGRLTVKVVAALTSGGESKISLPVRESQEQFCERYLPFFFRR